MWKLKVYLKINSADEIKELKSSHKFGMDMCCSMRSAKFAINYIPIWLIVYLEISLVTLKIIDICIIIDIMKQKFEFT